MRKLNNTVQRYKVKRFNKAYKWLLSVMVFYQHSSVYAATPTNEQLYDYQNVMWVVIGGLLVFFMQAGFALIESGSVRSKNTVNVLMKNYTDMAIGGLIFYILGYGLMAGNNPTGYVGQSEFLPEQLSNMQWAHLFFQMMFASTAATIASGAMAERIKFSGYLIGTLMTCGLIYPVVASWAWGGYYGGQGWLAQLGFIDFAGSSVVHSVGGWLALAGIIVLGPRIGRFAPDGTPRLIAGHNLTLVTLGGFILWLAWFGFNAGSTLTSSGNLGKIMLNTHLAGVSAVTAYLVISGVMRKAILLSDTVNISLAGLVAITAGCATMSPVYAIVTGGGACLAYLAVKRLLDNVQMDDAVYAVAVHVGGGVWGTLAAGLFYEGDLFSTHRIIVQMMGIGAMFVWSFGLGMVVYFVIEKTIGLRVLAQHEQRGLDFTEHAEGAYPEFQDSLFSQQTLAERH